MKGLPHLQSLIFELKKLPGVGPRSAERLIQHLLKSSDPELHRLSGLIKDLKQSIKACPECFHLTQNQELCSFCTDTSRTPQVLCVVEQSFDLFRIENCGGFKGRYHILNGLLSPLNQIHPKDLRLSELKQRIHKYQVQEIILALSSDLEGDTTALYITEHFKTDFLKISRPALGIPLGSNLSFVDDRTLAQALENRNCL